MAVAGIGLADIDGPRTSFARTHDHDRAVGVLAGVAAQPLAQRVIQEEPPGQTLPPINSKMSTAAMALAELKSTPWMKQRLTR